MCNKFLCHNSPKYLVGGTALRLAYNSPRYSEYLDFSLRSKVRQSEFAESIKKVAVLLPFVSITDLSEKYYTHFALLKIKEPFLRQAFSIKIEVSERPVRWKKEIDFISRTCKSEVVPLETVSFVVTLKRVFLDKKKAIKTRDKARDLFDLWWLGEKLGKSISIKLPSEKLIKARSELNQFLPEHMRKLVDSWRKK